MKIKNITTVFCLFIFSLNTWANENVTQDYTYKPSPFLKNLGIIKDGDKLSENDYNSLLEQRALKLITHKTMGHATFAMMTLAAFSGVMSNRGMDKANIFL